MELFLKQPGFCLGNERLVGRFELSRIRIVLQLCVGHRPVILGVRACSQIILPASGSIFEQMNEQPKYVAVGKRNLLVR